MAIEAIEKVRAAENKASEIVSKAEHDAAELLAQAGVSANERLTALETEEAKKMREAVSSARAEADKAFEDFKVEVSEKCENRRKEILNGKEEIIGRIIDAVKKG